MTGGAMKYTSLVALLASAGVAMGSMTAQAADLGGNCCAELEERVAEIEATTARKGNRKVSLQIYGQVSEAIVWWNDGAESNTYVVENYLPKNRLGFQGSAKINSDWSAGFRLELGIRAYRSSSANQLSLGASNGVQIATYNTLSVALRQANWYLHSNSWGRITVGRTEDAVNGTSSVNLANPDGFSGITGPGYINNSFFMRRAGTTGNSGLSNLPWGDAANFRNGDGPASMGYSETGSQVKYTSPFFLGQSKTSGFRFDASWGMDDFWSVALRYAETWGAFRVAGAVGYAKWSGGDRGMCSLGSVGNATNLASGGSNPALVSTGPGNNAGSNMDCGSIQASASVMHVPTGLYATVQGGQIDDNTTQAALVQSLGLALGSAAARSDGKSGIWGVQAGWQAKLNTLGNTTFWGQYVQYDTGFGVRNSIVQNVASNDQINSLGETALISGSQTTYWGGGITQEISAAAMNLYMGYHVGSTDIMLQNASPTATNQRRRANAVDDFQMFYTGATIRF